MCALFTAAIAARDQTPAAPMTPGQLAIALLTPGPELTAKLVAGLSNDQPGMRVVAARAIGVMGLNDPALEKALRDALADEQNDAVAAEIVRALLLLGGPEDTRVANAYLDRAGKRSVQVLAAFNASNSAALLERLPAYAARLGDRALDILDSILLNAAALTPSAREDLLRAALSIATDRSWADFLQKLSPRPSAPADVTIQTEALHSTRPKIRETTVWFLLGQLTDGVKIDPHLISAAHPDPSTTDVTWEQFGRELIARSVDRSAPIDRADLIAQGSATMPRVHVDGTLLTSGERSALEHALGNLAKTALTRSVVPAPEDPKPQNEVTLPAMRVMPSLWPGFLGDLLSAAHCKQTDDGIGALVVAYSGNGRPAKIALDSRALTGGCIVALNVLGRLTVRDDSGPVLRYGTESLLLLPRQDVIACADAFDPVAAEVLDNEHSDIVEPRKIRDVKPIYPQNAISARIQGTVLVQAVIGKTGCIRGARITRSIYPSIDFSALRAVLQWQFTPTLLNGRPVEVTMNVRVVFTLQ
jgi:TonB family protein